jgi:O-antigen ligase
MGASQAMHNEQVSYVHERSFDGSRWGPSISPWPAPTRVLLWLFVSLLAVSVGATSVLSPEVAGLIMFAAGVGALVALPLAFTLVVLAVAFVLPLTQLDPGVDTRLLAPTLLVPLAFKGLTAWRSAPGHAVALRLVPLCALATASITWSSDAAASSVAALALITVVACLFLIPAATDKVAVLQTLRWLVSALVIASAFISLTPIGQLAGRSRGIFGNPNALAILCLFAVPLLMRGRWPLLLPLTVVLAYSTASRAAVAAIAVGVLFYFLSARTSRMAVRVSAVLLVAAAFTAAILALDPTASVSPGSAQSSGVSVFRYENSRDFEWAAAVQAWRESPMIGQGFGAAKIETGNSYLKVFVDLGVLGLVAGAPFVLLLLRRLVVSRDPLVVGSIASGLVSSSFEAWLLTAGSAFFILFCLVIQTEEVDSSD